MKYGDIPEMAEAMRYREELDRQIDEAIARGATVNEVRKIRGLPPHPGIIGSSRVLAVSFRFEPVADIPIIVEG